MGFDALGAWTRTYFAVFVGMYGQDVLGFVLRNKIGSKRAEKCVMFVVVGEQCILELIKISNF